MFFVYIIREYDRFLHQRWVLNKVHTKEYATKILKINSSLPIILNLLNIFLNRRQIHLLNPHDRNNDVINVTSEATNKQPIMICDIITGLKINYDTVQIHEVIFYRVDLQIKEQN